MKKNLFVLLILLSTLLSVRSQTWQALGPFNRTGSGGSPGQGSGIVTTIAFHPKYNTADASIGGAINKTIFAGSPFGGIWISRDDGANWSTTDPLSQYTNLSTDGFRGCGVVDIVADVNSPTTLYASFSSSEYADGFGTVGMNNYYPTTGIYKYTPGTGWVGKLVYPYQSNHSVYELEMHPTNSSIIFACTDAGVIKSVDGGTSWSAAIATEGAGKPFRNILFDPTNSNIAFCSGREVYKSTDGGNTFSSISNFVPLIPDINGGIVQTNITVISATSVYARVHYNKTGGGRQEAFFKYNGSTWTSLPIFSIARAEYHYDRMPMASKKVGTTEYVFAGSEVINLYNSSLATNPWSTVSDYNTVMHADLHDIVFSPDGTTLMASHDGGISLATTNFYTTPNWVTKNTGLNISTIISFSGSQKDANIILTGEHDNGNSIVKNATAGTPTWNGYQVCDGGDKMTSLFDPNEWYDRMTQYGGSGIYRNSTGNESNMYSGSLVFSNATTLPVTTLSPQHDQFEEFGDKKPMVMDPNNPNIIYRGSNILLRSMDKGANSQILFRKSDCFETSNLDPHSHINCIAIAPTNSNYLYINFINPYSFEPTFNNHIYKTTNALTATYAAPCVHTSASEGVVCSNWTEITPNFGIANKKSVINSIAVSDKDPNMIWAGFSYNQDITPATARKNYLVWKYDGSTWVDWSQGLPDQVSITSLVYERGSNDGLYAGTDVGGVFYRNNTTGGWISYGAGMPHAIVNQLEVNYSENTVRAATYGRGLWKNSLYCPGAPFTSPDPCNECNSATNYFWEGTTVTVKNTTLTTYKHFVRAVNTIDILPNTTITASATANYDFFIHGCGPTQPNSYKRLIKETDDDNVVLDMGEEEEEESGIAAFPNPNNGAFTLNTQNEKVKDIFVYDMLGKIVYSKQHTTDKMLNINISSSPKGVYFVKVIFDDKTETIKISNQ